MSDVILIVVIVSTSLVLGACGYAWWHVCPQITIIPPAAKEPAPAPSIEPLPKVAPLPTVKMRFVSNSGRLLGETTFRGRRPANFTYRTGDGLLGNFVCSAQDDGVWVYRRVSVERER